MKFNEMGIDFKVGFATDKDENQWLLRIPRRPDLGKQIAKEKLILQLVWQTSHCASSRLENCERRAGSVSIIEWKTRFDL